MPDRLTIDAAIEKLSPYRRQYGGDTAIAIPAKADGDEGCRAATDIADRGAVGLVVISSHAGGDGEAAVAEQGGAARAASAGGRDAVQPDCPGHKDISR